MKNFSPEQYKEVKTSNGIVAIVIINSLEKSLEGTRSSKVVYEIQVVNRIFGDIKEIDTVWNYGNPILKKGEKYLVILSQGK